MKKANKILMTSVAILLCLVLISTTVLSGIFARFVVMRGMDSTMGFKRFGVELSLTVDPTFESAIGSSNVKKVYDGNSVTITITNVKMAPGDDYSDALRIHLSGTPNVNTKFTMSFSGITYTDTAFAVPADRGFRSDIVGKIFFPIAIRFGYLNEFYDATSSWRNSKYESTRNAVATFINENIALDEKPNNYSAVKTFEKGVPIAFHTIDQSTSATNINDFGLGFCWNFETTRDITPKLSKTETDQLATYFAEKNPTFTFKVTVKVEQTS